MKRKDKAFIIAVLCAVIVCVIFLAVVIFTDPISALALRSEAKEMLAAEGESVVLISDTRAGGEDPFTNAETDLRGDDAENMKQKLLGVLTQTKYSDASSQQGTVWQRSATIYVGDQTVRIYFDEDEIILKGKGKAYSFEPKDGEAYAELYGEIEALLNK